MKKIIPFKKDIIFKNNLCEITSISLEHSLHISDNNLITGDFVVSGDYRMTDSSINTDSFIYNLPFDINMDDRYDLKNVEIDIDDFYYEIKNNNVLSVNIEVLIDKLEEKPLIVEKERIIETLPIMEEKETMIFKEKEIISPELIRNDKEEVEMKKDLISYTQEATIKNEVKSLFDNIDDSNDTFATYYVYIVREIDTLDVILQKYNVSREDVEMYNDLSDIKVGDKIIIPSLNAQV